MVAGGSNSNQQMVRVFRGQNDPITGHTWNGIVDISSNWRESYSKSSNSSTGKPTNMTYEITSTLGHMVDKIQWRPTVQVTLDAAKLKTHLQNTGTDATDPLTSLASVKFLPNWTRKLLSKWELNQNAHQVYWLTQRDMTHIASEQYTPEEHKYHAALNNGIFRNSRKRNTVGGPRYIYKKGTGTAAYWDDKVPTHKAKYSTVTPASGSLKDQATQHDVVESRFPEHDPNVLYSEYTQQYYNEIDLVDNEMLAATFDGWDAVTGYSADAYGGDTTWANVNGSIGGVVTDANKKTQRINRIMYAIFGVQAGATPTAANNITFDWDLCYEFQTPFHRSIQYAFPILLCVNNPELRLVLEDWQNWMRNYHECPFVDMTISSTKMWTHYYDTTLAYWNSKYSIGKQLNYWVPWFQTHTYDYPQTISFAGTGDPSVQTYTKTIPVHITNIDRVARMLLVEAQSSNHTVPRGAQGGNFEDLKLDIFRDAVLKVNNELVLTKLENPDVNQHLGLVQRHQKFPRNASEPTGETVFIPLGVDGNIENPGGGSVDFHPIYNNSVVHVTLDGSKIEALYNSNRPGVTNDAITRTGNSPNYTYSIAGHLHIRVTALVQEVVTFQSGQLYNQGS